MRFQELMPDVLHWLGVKKIHRLVSMSNMKGRRDHRLGIVVRQRVDILDSPDPGRCLRVEMDAKKAAGYFTPGAVPDPEALKRDQGTRAMSGEAAAAEEAAGLAAHHAGHPRALLQPAAAACPGRRKPLVHGGPGLPRNRGARGGRQHAQRRYPKLHVPFH